MYFKGIGVSFLPLSLFCFVHSIVSSVFLYKFRLISIMIQYNLRSLPPHDYVVMNSGMDLKENEEFHDSFDFSPETVPPGTSHRNPSSQSSTPLTPKRGANGLQDKIAELTMAVNQAEAENDELERQAEVAKLKIKHHALHKRIASCRVKPLVSKQFQLNMQDPGSLL